MAAEGAEPRATVAREVTLRGVGLHSGEPVALRLRPSPPDLGIVFRVPCAAGFGEIPARYAAIAGARNATTLAAGGAEVHTVEHLLAALSMSGIDDAVAELDATEPPAVDGSAAPFLELIERAGREPHGGARTAIEIVDSVVVEDGVRRIGFEPGAGLEIDCEIDFESAAIGRQRVSWKHLDGERFATEVAPARTFGFMKDVDALRAVGLARGASLENTIVVDGDHIRSDGLRFPDEFARHKALDLIGDLALLGAPLIGRVHVTRGGHALHHAGIRALLETPGAYRMVSL